MKVYITKYALAKGIQEREVILSSGTPHVCTEKIGSYSNYFLKPDWHETKEQALEQAEKMRLRKIDSLKRKIHKLENLNFK